MNNENIEREKVINFINACNELVNGKFILADIKISKILKAISESTGVYNLIEEHMINYDFDTEFESCVATDSTGVERFILPKEEEKIIPLVFCLLVEIDSKRIGFNDFIKAQFPYANNQNEEYDSFAKTIVIPFRNAIADYFNVDIKELEKENVKNVEPTNNVIDEKLKEHLAQVKDLEEKLNNAEEKADVKITVIETNDPNVSVEELADALVESQKISQEAEETELLFKRILRLTRILDDKLVYVRNPLKKSNIGLLLDALFEACELRNVKIIVAVVMAINNIAYKERSMKNEIKELNTICYDFYE